MTDDAKQFGSDYDQAGRRVMLDLAAEQGPFFWICPAEIGSTPDELAMCAKGTMAKERRDELENLVTLRMTELSQMDIPGVEWWMPPRRQWN